MSKFIIILGPPAVGKMTVGQEIQKLTNFKLFHNHLIIDAILPLFDFESINFKVIVNEFRTRVFEEVIIAKLDGIIFTYVLAINKRSSIKQLYQWIELFKENDAEIYIIELQANLDERLKRNETINRLNHKQSKRNIELSRHILLKNEEELIMQSPPCFFGILPYLKIVTDNLSSKETAKIILGHFNFFKKL